VFANPTLEPYDGDAWLAWWLHYCCQFGQYIGCFVSGDFSVAGYPDDGDGCGIKVEFVRGIMDVMYCLLPRPMV
jgi:hypothetical protein